MLGLGPSRTLSSNSLIKEKNLMYTTPQLLPLKKSTKVNLFFQFYLVHILNLNRKCLT